MTQSLRVPVIIAGGLYHLNVQVEADQVGAICGLSAPNLQDQLLELLSDTTLEENKSNHIDDPLKWVLLAYFHHDRKWCVADGADADNSAKFHNDRMAQFHKLRCYLEQEQNARSTERIHEP